MENKTKILAFAAVALMFAVCFIGFVAISDDAVDAEGGDSSAVPVDKGPLDGKCTIVGNMTYADGKYTFTNDVTVTLTANISMENVKFVGGNKLTITSEAGKHFTLNVTYNFGTKIKDDAGRIFQVSNFVLENASLNVVQLDDIKTIENNQPGGSVFGEAHVEVKDSSTVVTEKPTKMTITTNKYANRVFYNNNSSLSIIGENAKVILNNASSLTASLSMTNGATLEINNPINTAGNFYPNISNDAGKKVNITVTGAAGNHAVFFYGTNGYGKSEVGVLKNCNITTNGIVGIYGSDKIICATGTIIDADSIVAVNATKTFEPRVYYEAAGISNAILIVNKVSNPITNDYKDSTGTKILKLEGVTFNGSTVIDSGVSLIGTITNNGTLRIEDSTTITTVNTSKVVNKGVVIDERAKDEAAVPVTNDGTVVAKNNADKYKEAKVDVIVQDPETAKKTDGTVVVDENKFIFIDAITTTGKLNIVMNDGYKQYTVTIPEGTVIAAGTVISVSFIEYQSDSVTRYQINTPGIENFSMKLPCQIGFKKAKVYCDDSELGVSKVRYDAGTGYVTFDASHNSVFTIVLSNASPAGTTTVSGGDTTNDYSLVIAFVVLVASLGFLVHVIRKR